MTIKQIMLPLFGDPGPTTFEAIDKCVALAIDIGARASAMVIETEVDMRPMVMMPGDLNYAETAEKTRSFASARDLLSAFDSAALKLGARHEQTLRKLPAQDIPTYLAACARISDLALVPVKSHNAQCEDVVERLIFESGRPVLLCPEQLAPQLVSTFDHVAIAWDDTAPAARAVADAMPLLQAAASVHIFTVTDAATPAERESGAALAGHLALHGVTASFATVKRDGSSVGMVFGKFAKTHAIDLLVMGAYRHSRVNEWVWGGASNTIISQPPCWVLMSH